MKRKLVGLLCVLCILSVTSCSEVVVTDSSDTSSSDFGSKLGRAVLFAVDSALAPDAEFKPAGDMQIFKEEINLPRLRGTNHLTDVQKNAVLLAYTYILSSAYSQSSLRSLLEEDGFVAEDIDTVFDYMKIDWGTQAKKKAVLLYSFVKPDYDTLYEQLINNGFTEEEAKEGADYVQSR